MTKDSLKQSLVISNVLFIVRSFYNKYIFPVYFTRILKTIKIDVGISYGLNFKMDVLFKSIIISWILSATIYASMKYNYKKLWYKNQYYKVYRILCDKW